MSNNCANCGAEIERRNSATRLVACPYCDTTQIFKDDAFHLAGQQGVMQDVPTLLKLREKTVIEGIPLTPLGHARFSYGRGWWDEFWCESGDQTIWVSVDEGDVAVERVLENPPKGFDPKLGATCEINGRRYTVAEAQTGECIAVRGEFPEMIEIGETHLYFDLSGPDGRIVTLEQWEDQEAWFEGRWLDPWTAKAAE